MNKRWKTAAGPFAAAVAITLVEWAHRSEAFRLPAPTAYYLTAIVAAAFFSGLAGGAIAVFLTIFHALFFLSLPGSLFSYDADGLLRLAVLAVSAPALLWMTVALERRADRSLARQLELERQHNLQLTSAQEAIRRAEEQSRLILNAIPAMVVYLDRDKRVRFYNRAYANCFGLPEAGANLQRLAEIVGEQAFRNELERNMDAVLAGTPVTFERSLTDARGETLQIEARLVPQLEQDGSVSGLFSLLIDVTRRRQVEAQLGDVNERLARALRGSNLALWEWSAKNNNVYLSPEWSGMLDGEERGMVIPLDRLADKVHPRERPKLEQAFRAVIVGETDTYEAEHRVLSRTGEWKWFHSVGRVVARDDSGRALRIAGTNSEISDRKHVELALRESEAKLRLVTDSVPAMIAYLDAGERYLFANRLYAGHVGLSRREIEGRTMREVLGEEFYALTQPQVREVLAGRATRFERSHRSADGARLDLSVHYVPHLADDGSVPGFYALLVDITERKRVERMKDEFVSMVSHELRTPLTSILGSLDTVMTQFDEAWTGEAKAMIDIAYRNSERLLRLTEDILDIEKMELGAIRMSPRAVELAELLRESVQANAGLAGRLGIRIALAAEQPCRVEADPERLLQVLANLISNAARHSPAGGAVEIALERVEDRARVSVSDRGPGIPEPLRGRLFSRFAHVAVPGKREGTGLGLAISKEIMERSGGTIGWHPRPGGGTTFYFELPALAG